jgi:asparagine synthase (glutamine-hydrolysing)
VIAADRGAGGRKSPTAAPRLTELEIALATVFGLEPAQVPLDQAAGLDPLQALEAAMRPALERPPCLVSFSGGRDSSCLLAAAAHLARREGLEAPIPVTLRFPDVPEADESSWQELVVGHLGLGEWQRLTLEDGDLIGSAAAHVLRRHGVLYPPNHFLIDTVMRAAPSGAAVLTGLGGDQLFGSWRWSSVGDLLARRRRPEARDLLRLVYVSVPAPLREPRERARERPDLPGWLRPEAAREALSLAAHRAAQEPAWWRDRIRWRLRRRDLAACRESLALLAADAGVRAVAPILDPAFVAALARAGGRSGYGDRTATMRAVFEDLVPGELLARSTKGTATSMFWAGSPSFAERWGGGGVDPGLVDHEALRREWRAPAPDGRTALLLQAAWLATEGDRHAGDSLDRSAADEGSRD